MEFSGTASATKKLAHSAYGGLNERIYLKEAEIRIIWLGLLPGKQPLGLAQVSRQVPPV